MSNYTSSTCCIVDLIVNQVSKSERKVLRHVASRSTLLRILRAAGVVLPRVDFVPPSERESVRWQANVEYTILRKLGIVARSPRTS